MLFKNRSSVPWLVFLLFCGLFLNNSRKENKGEERERMGLFFPPLLACLSVFQEHWIQTPSNVADLNFSLRA